MKVVTHDGKFHGDEIFACAVLKLIYPEVEIIRTRDEKFFTKADLLIDIGTKLDNEKFFDHHQLDFNKKRENGMPFASAGLIWKKFYSKLTTKDVYEYLDIKIFQFIDADDSGLRVFEATKCEPYTIGNVIEDLNNNSAKSDENFFFVLDFITKLLKNEIVRTEELFKAKKIIEEKLKNNKEEFLVLDKYIPWKEWLVGNGKIKFVIYKGSDSSDRWCSVGVPKKKIGYERIAYFPEKWAGLSDDKLVKATGIEGAKFCHKLRFICVAKTEDDAIKLTKLAIEKNGNRI
ncbi:MAG: MYG1 family protein [Candidatus Pacearchaeota archaeon]